METKYKTKFIEVTPLGKGFSFKSSANGDQLARDVQATLEEMERQGYELHSNTPVTGYTSMSIPTMFGVMLVFRKTREE